MALGSCLGCIVSKKRQVCKLVSTVPFPEKKIVYALWENQGDIALEGHSQTDTPAHTDRRPHPRSPRVASHCKGHVPYTALTASCPFVWPGEVTRLLSLSLPAPHRCRPKSHCGICFFPLLSCQVSSGPACKGL